MPTFPGMCDVSCRLQLAGNPRPAFITFGVGAGLTDPDDVAANVIQAWLATGSANSRLDSGVTLTEVIARLGVSGEEDLIGNATNATAGLANVVSPSANVALLVHKRTARGGRRGRGRLFMPWFISNNNVAEDGTITTSSLTPIQTAMTAFYTALQTEGVPMFILHRPGQSAEGNPTAVTSLVCSNLVATQRRRLGR